MKIAVTGALGYIGCRLLQSLASDPKFTAVLIDDLSAGNAAGLEALTPGRFSFYKEDVLEADLKARFAGCDAVIHLAAIADPAVSFARPEAVRRQNTEAVRRAAEACAAMGIPLIFPSSTSVYGEPNAVPDEDCASLLPQTPYAESKLLAEKVLQDAGRNAGLRFVVLRFGTIFGPSPGLRAHTAVGKFCLQAISGEPLTVWRTAYSQIRPYLYIEDAVRALIFAARQELRPGEIYNVVTQNAPLSRILDCLREEVPGLEWRETESPAMNSFSREIPSGKIRAAGFDFYGDLHRGICETLESLAVKPGRAGHKSGQF